MIKASATGADGRKIALLGLTDKNIERMREGKPIHIFGEEMGLGALTIYIITGKDEETIAKQLKPLIGRQTTVRHETKQNRQ